MPGKQIPVTPRDYRNTIGLFATGVTVLAMNDGDHVRAMTANAVTSLSLDPLLVICCIDKKANCLPYFRLNENFSLNILYRHQDVLSNYFAGIWAEDAAPPDFEFVPWENCSRLAGGMAAVACELQEKIEGGDHWIMIGRVVALWQAEDLDDPLIYYRGQYRGLAIPDEDQIDNLRVP